MEVALLLCHNVLKEHEIRFVFDTFSMRYVGFPQIISSICNPLQNVHVIQRQRTNSPYFFHCIFLKTPSHENFIKYQDKFPSVISSFITVILM